MIEQLDVCIDLPTMMLVEDSIEKSFVPYFDSFNSDDFSSLY